MANELTDSDREAIDRIYDRDLPEDTTDAAIYLAGKAAGIAEGLERAAQLIGDTPCYSPAQGRMYADLCDHVRALKASA